MELAVLRVVEMMGNDNFFRRQGMICMAEPFARLLAGSPYFLRSKYCVGSESITLHLMDQEPIVAPTYTMQVRAWLSLSLSTSVMYTYIPDRGCGHMHRTILLP